MSFELLKEALPNFYKELLELLKITFPTGGSISKPLKKPFQVSDKALQASREYSPTFKRS